MAKLKLQPEPIFKEKVGIHVPGSVPSRVEFTFKHRTRDEIQKLLEQLGEMDDTAMIMAVASGWDLVDDFTEANVAELAQSYVAAPKEIFETYLRALTGAREKN